MTRSVPPPGGAGDRTFSDRARNDQLALEPVVPHLASTLASRALTLVSRFSIRVTRFFRWLARLV